MRAFFRNLISALLLAILISFYLVVIYVSSQTENVNDFTKFYASARYYFEGKSIYTPVKIDAFGEARAEVRERFATESPHPNLNPPTQTLAMLPLALLDYSTAFIVWSTLSLIAGLLAVYLIFNAFRKEWSQHLHVFGASILLLAYFPTLTNFSLGQVATFLLLLLVVSWLALRAGNERVAGIALGLALSLKIFTGLFLLVFIVRRRWRLVGWYLGTFVLANLLAVLVFGFDAIQEYRAILNSVDWYAASWNASFLGFFTRILDGTANISQLNLPTLATALSFGFSILAVLVLIWAARLRLVHEEAQEDLLFSLTAILMLLISPLGWIYYFVLLIIPATVVWRISSQLSTTSYKTFILIGWALSTVPHRLTQPAEITIAHSFFWSGFYTYALLIFIGSILGLFVHLSKKYSGREAGFAQPGKTSVT